MGCRPVALVITRVHKCMNYGSKKLKSRGLHEKHAVATWSLGNHFSVHLWTQGNQEKPVPR
jgi:hypothetical protein